MKILTQQKRKKLVRQATQIVTNKKKLLVQFLKRRGSIYLIILSFFILFMPFVHLFYYGDSDVKGNFFQFGWMSSFLFALALPSDLLAISMLLRYYGKKKNEPFLKVFSKLLMIVGSFYLAWTFWTTPKEFTDISIEYYFSVLIILTIGIFILANKIDKMSAKIDEELRQNIEKFRLIIENLIDFVWSKKEDSLQPKKYAQQFIKELQDNDVV